MNCILSKEDFVKTIEEIKKVYTYQESLNNFLHNHGAEGYIFQPDCTDTALRLLHIMFGDADFGDWISYFCLELEFGKKWKEGTIIEKDGTDIKLATAEDLYDYLLKCE